MARMLMYHDDLPETFEEGVDVDERSFELSWSKPQPPHRPKGWKRWSSPENAAVGVDQGPQEDTGPVRPPASGAGSGRDKWLAYAAGIGLALAGDEGKHDIIKAVNKAENPQEEE